MTNVLSNIFLPAPDSRKVSCLKCGQRVVKMKDGRLFRHHLDRDKAQLEWEAAGMPSYASDAPKRMPVEWCPAGLTVFP